jgi:stringent starvation protein B
MAEQAAAPATKPQAASSGPATVDGLLGKEGGGNILSKHRSGVWASPGTPIDLSGTNLRLPVEYVSDEEVQKAIHDGSVVVIAIGSDNLPFAVRKKPDKDEVVMTLSASQAGTAEAGTELPPNSHPSQDAGAKRMTPDEAARMTERLAENMIPRVIMVEDPDKEAREQRHQQLKAEKEKADKAKK